MYTCSLSAIWLIFLFLTLHHIPFYVCIPASFSSYHVILKESLMQRRLSVCCIFGGTHFLLQISTQRVPLSMTHIVNVQHFQFFSSLFFVFWSLIFVFWHSLEYCCYKEIHTNLHNIMFSKRFPLLSYSKTIIYTFLYLFTLLDWPLKISKNTTLWVWWTIVLQFFLKNCLTASEFN